MSIRISKSVKGLLVASAAAVSAVGAAGAATAQPYGYGYQDRPRATYCDARTSERQVAGTVFGGVAGAALGSGVAGRGDRNEGAVIGGVLGALAGNAIARNSGRDCRYGDGYRDTRYGYRDSGYRNDGYAYYDEREARREQRRYERAERRYQQEQYRYGRGYDYNY